MIEEPLDDLVARLERERLEADRLYQDALTALDRACAAAPALPDAPPVAPPAPTDAINQRWDILKTPSSSESGLKGRLQAFIWRVVGPRLEAQREFNAAVVEHINRTSPASQQIPATVHALVEVLRRELERVAYFQWLLVTYFRTITLYVDTKDRSSGAPELRDRLALVEQRLQAIKRELESGVRAPTRPGGDAFSASLDSPAYVGFEDRFRGSRAEVESRAEEYLPLLDSASDVVDIGCGRGELLDLLRARGVRACGVDANAAMVDLCRGRGLEVEQGDALGYLERQPDGSIGALVAIQVVEHFEPAYLVRFLDAAFHKLRPGAVLVLETINAACWLAFFEAYLRDLTHKRALNPDTLKYLVEASGFRTVDVRFRHPVQESDRLPGVTVQSVGEGAPAAVADLARALNAHAEALNARLFSYADYAVIARR